MFCYSMLKFSGPKVNSLIILDVSRLFFPSGYSSIELSCSVFLIVLLYLPLFLSFLIPFSWLSFSPLIYVYIMDKL
jgi:hypothetical protein